MTTVLGPDHAMWSPPDSCGHNIGQFNRNQNNNEIKLRMISPRQNNIITQQQQVVRWVLKAVNILTVWQLYAYTEVYGTAKKQLINKH